MVFRLELFAREIPDCPLPSALVPEIPNPIVLPRIVLSVALSSRIPLVPLPLITLAEFGNVPPMVLKLAPLSSSIPEEVFPRASNPVTSVPTKFSATMLFVTVAPES